MKSRLAERREESASLGAAATAVSTAAESVVLFWASQQCFDPSPQSCACMRMQRLPPVGDGALQTRAARSPRCLPMRSCNAAGAGGKGLSSKLPCMCGWLSSCMSGLQIGMRDLPFGAAATYCRGGRAVPAWPGGSRGDGSQNSKFIHNDSCTGKMRG